MKILPLKSTNSFLLLLLCFVLGLTTSCNTKSGKSNNDTFEEKPVTAVPAPDTTNIQPQIQTPPPQENKPLAKLPPKVCDPGFTVIGKPKPNFYVYYVTGFKPGEFKCWEELEKHGISLCQGEPCTIYYLDIAKVTIHASPPYVDPAVLKEHGVGQFEHGAHWWESKGAKQLWGRPGKEFVYYNTNNNAGG
jgi:hypothetical protein